MNKERITEILKYWAQVGLENPHYNFDDPKTEDHIYGRLIRLGVSDRDKTILLDQKKEYTDRDGVRIIQKSAFQDWIDYYRRKEGISTYVDPKWPYFCQFVSKNPEAQNSSNHIKVYIPLDGAHIQTGAKMIFDFLTENNISHASKIGKKIRFDDIVIRLTNQQDADKLLNYVKNNSYIQEGLIVASPFAVQKDGIALAVDGRKSYNSTIASLLRMYLADCQKKRRLKQVSYEEFYYFIANKYNEEFAEKRGDSFAREFGFQNDPASRKNYREIIELIIRAQFKNFTYNDLIEHYNKCTGRRKEEVEINGISPYTESLLITAIEGMTKRFNSSQSGLLSVERYIIVGDPTYLTRNNGLREKITNSNMRQEILRYLRQTKIPIRRFINDVLDKHNYTTNYQNSPRYY